MTSSGSDEAGADGRQGIQSVEIATTVLTALESGGGPMALGEIARRTGMQSSKLHRYLVSLTRAGLASRSPSSGLYDLGPVMRRLGAEALRRADDVAIASEYAPVLRDSTGHSVNLAVWSDAGPVIVRWDHGSSVLPLSVRVGATLPLLASSAGRVFLAVLPERMTTSALAASRKQLQSSSLSDVDLAEIVATVRNTGFAVTTGGVIPGISSISAAIPAAAEELPLVVSVVFPREQVSEREMARVEGRLSSMIQTVSRQLGVVA